MCIVKLMLPRLQTAISSCEVFKVISVHKLELCTTPMCCCGERKLQTSLKVTQGWPVSNNMPSIFRHKVTAGNFLKLRILPFEAFSSYSVYFASNASPYKSCNSGTSSGEKRVQSFSSATRFMNKSGIQLAVFM